MKPEQWARLKHFTAAEFGAGAEHMDAGLMAMLDATREAAGVPMVVTSNFRDGDPLAHGRGNAVDVADNAAGKNISSGFRIAVVRAALEIGFVRIGIYDRHVHIDVDRTLPQNVMWIGESK